ncbi:hypothetical protein Xaut_4526 [Xanthobacter versatilis]|uniref:DNA transposition protein n=1 Tax=Xanthobacter autotrophicus (strain ATCC BAA-1158 / Py2) TaxID=78245 RepID=A7IP01_XANP2|nr:hypothetical protein Xaut_4526 [Xanthobacter autotrophicus Py2]
MARRPASPDQLDLLTDWQPSQPVEAFAPEMVRGASIAVSISKAVSQALSDCGRSRAEVAEAMSQFLDEQVSEHMLNAYASQARGEHIINLVRFVALLNETHDRRLLELIASMFGWAVIERKYLPAIALAERMERRAKLDREIDADRNVLRKNGVL